MLSQQRPRQYTNAGKMLRELRARIGNLSQESLAEKLSVEVAALRTWEQGSQRPKSSQSSGATNTRTVDQVIDGLLSIAGEYVKNRYRNDEERKEEFYKVNVQIGAIRAEWLPLTATPGIDASTPLSQGAIASGEFLSGQERAFVSTSPNEGQTRAPATPPADLAKVKLESIVAALNSVDAEVDETIARDNQDSQTHFIGEFPGHLRHVIDMVKEAKSSLTVMIDCVDYGSFSNPDLHEELIRAIHDSLTDEKKPDFTVKMLITDKPAPISKASPFYGRSFETLRKEEAFQEVFRGYLRHHYEYRNSPPANEAEFINILQKQQEKSRGRLHDAGSGAKIFDLDGNSIKRCEVVGASLEQPKKKPSPNSSDLFFWIADGKKAVFLFLNTGPSAWEITFQTEELELVNIFNGIFTQHWKGP